VSIAISYSGKQGNIAKSVMIAVKSIHIIEESFDVIQQHNDVPKLEFRCIYSKRLEAIFMIHVFFHAYIIFIILVAYTTYMCDHVILLEKTYRFAISLF
jgi:hypothetical protein